MRPNFFMCWKCLATFTVMLFITSCLTTAHTPQQKYLDNTSLSGIRNIAVLVTVSPPEVIYSQTEGINWIIPILVSPILAPIATSIAIHVQENSMLNEDKAHSENVENNFNLSVYEEKLSQSFIETLKKSSHFETIDYKKDNSLDNKLLVSDGYEGVIRLFLNNLILEKVSNEDVKLSANITAKMTNLKSSEIIWDRDDSTVSAEKHTISYYEKNGLEELELMLEKSGKRLAYDFIYLK